MWSMGIIHSFLEKKKFPPSRKNYNTLAGSCQGQFKIQQMMFMILAVFLLFILVGLFFIRFQVAGIKESYSDLQTTKAISSLEVISSLPELSYSSSEVLTLDEDKLKILTQKEKTEYEDFWPVSSIKVYKIHPQIKEVIKCPSFDCNYYDIYDSGLEDKKEYSTFVSICTKKRSQGYVYDYCEIGKIVVGVKNA